ncbi:hypothetical protein [Sulfurospirillum multivorans]|nr:hypothetical protein [Sulfurospirillum multivorans]QEH07210.1 hypothetical protein SMN_2453 [Sulfurospirillum multivorans]
MTINKVVFFEIIFFRSLSIVLQLVFLKLYSNYLSVYELGIYYLLVTLSYSINAFLLVPLDYFQQSKLHYLKSAQKSLRSFLPLNKQIFYIVVFLMVLTECTIFFIDSSLLFTVLLIFLLSPLFYFNTVVRGFLNNLDYRRNAIYTLVGEGFIKISFFLLLIQYFNASAVLLLVATILATFCISVILYLLLRKKEEYLIPEKATFSSQEVFHFSYPISISAIINWIQMQGYRVLLAPLGYIEIMGLYTTVSNVGQSGMNAASVIYSQLFVPNLYKTNGKDIFGYTKIAFGVILVVILVSTFFSKEIVTLLTNSFFSQYSYLIFYGILAEGSNMIIGGLSIYLMIHNLTAKTIVASWAGLITFIVSFGFLYFLNIFSVWTIGLPIIFSQLGVVIYMIYLVFYKYKKGCEIE